MWLPAPSRRPGTSGRPRKHGRQLALSGPAACPDPQVTTSTVTSRYGMARAAAWDRVHPRLTHRAAWLDHDGPLPVIEGTLIRLQVDYLPGDRDPKPVWLWWSRTGATPADVDRCWQSFLRRFDLETGKVGAPCLVGGQRGGPACHSHMVLCGGRPSGRWSTTTRSRVPRRMGSSPCQLSLNQPRSPWMTECTGCQASIRTVP
jgi:hypothetical protein